MSKETKPTWTNPEPAIHHAPHAAAYVAKAVGLKDGGKTGREAERVWQWEHLAPELRSIGFPTGL